LGLVIAPQQGAGSGLNVGHPIVTMRNLWHSSEKVREVIELPFGVVSRFGPGIGVLDEGKGRFWGLSCRLGFAIASPAVKRIPFM